MGYYLAKLFCIFNYKQLAVDIFGEDTLKMPPASKNMAMGDMCSIYIQWRGSADSVYVTGCWLQWKSKVPLYRNKLDPNLWEGNIDLPLKYYEVFELNFIVDDIWVTSPNMACKITDSGNIKNYIILEPEEEPTQT